MSPPRDALPEHTEYRDEGCSVAPACLACPLPVCRYDEVAGLRSIARVERERKIVELRADGASVAAIAEGLNISRRTVFRALTPRRAA